MSATGNADVGKLVLQLELGNLLFGESLHIMRKKDAVVGKELHL